MIVVDIKQKVGETWITKGGAKVVIIRVEPGLSNPILAVRDNKHLIRYTHDGKVSETTTTDFLDLKEKL